MPEVIESLRNANLGWQYYKNYYESNGDPFLLENKNYTILSRRFIDSSNFFRIECNNSFELKVNYPGLITGSGYTHEYTGEDKDGAFKIGFFFDHVSGLPYITGHGVKGALRNVFPNHKNERYPEQKAKFIVDLLREKAIKPEQIFEEYLKKENIHNVPYSDFSFATLLGGLIFEGCKPIAYKNNEFVFSQLSMKDKDIFYECFIARGGENGLFLADDYITPHIPDPLKNPVPIKFLKILSGVVFCFQFDLKDNLLKAEQKEDLFKSLLLTFGIGAKTNVGYGQFALPEINKSGQHPKSGKSGETSTRDFHNANSNITDAITKSSDPVAKKILAQSVWYGLIIGEKGDNVLLSFDVDDEKVVIKKKKNRITGYVANESQKVRIVFKTAFVNDSPDFSAIVVP